MPFGTANYQERVCRLAGIIAVVIQPQQSVWGTQVIDTEALLERYRKEIEDLKKRLAEREAEAPVRTRRLSAREVSLFVVLFCEYMLIWLFSNWRSPEL